MPHGFYVGLTGVMSGRQNYDKIRITDERLCCTQPVAYSYNDPLLGTADLAENSSVLALPFVMLFL